MELAVQVARKVDIVRQGSTGFQLKYPEGTPKSTADCMQVARAGHISAGMFAVTREWTELAVHYLAARGDASRAASLVECFADPRWERRCDRTELAVLLHELIPSVPLVRPMPVLSRPGKFSNHR
jgi:hypothetical protein